MISVGATLTGRTGANMDTHNRIEALMHQLKGLYKQLAAMRKQMMETDDPALKLIMIKALAEMQQYIQMVEAQLAQLGENDQRKRAVKAEAEREADQETTKDLF